ASSTGFGARVATPSELREWSTQYRSAELHFGGHSAGSAQANRGGNGYPQQCYGARSYASGTWAGTRRDGGAAQRIAFLLCASGISNRRKPAHARGSSGQKRSRYA